MGQENPLNRGQKPAANRERAVIADTRAAQVEPSRRVRRQRGGVGDEEFLLLLAHLREPSPAQVGNVVGRIALDVELAVGRIDMDAQLAVVGHAMKLPADAAAVAEQRHAADQVRVAIHVPRAGHSNRPDRIERNPVPGHAQVV